MGNLTDMFDLGGTPIPVIPEVVAPLQYFVQGVAKDEEQQVFYVTNVMPGGITLPGESGPVSSAQRNINGDMAVSQVLLDGTVTGTMYLTTFGHGQTLGVESVDTGFGEGGFGEGDFGGISSWLWVETDAHMDGTGFGSGRKVARVLYQAGKVIDSTTPGLDIYDPIPGATRVFPSLDVERNRLLLSWFNGTSRFYNTYDLADFKLHAFTPLTSVQQVGVTGTLQSCALHGNTIYMQEGDAYSVGNPPPGNTYQVAMNATTGAFIERTLNTQGPDFPYREPEGMTVIASPTGPQLVSMFTAASTIPRTMVMFSYGPRSAGGEWLFTTPTVDEAPFAWNDLMVRFRISRGISVQEVSPGQYEQVRYDAYTQELGATNLPPSPNQDTDFWPLASQDLHYFRGGYEWTVSDQVRQDIIDSGAAEASNFVAVTPDTGFGLGGFGEGGFGE